MVYITRISFVFEPNFIYSMIYNLVDKLLALRLNKIKNNELPYKNSVPTYICNNIIFVFFFSSFFQIKKRSGFPMV